MKTLDLYIDRTGAKCTPTANCDITERQGSYALFRYQDKVLIHWPAYSPGYADLIGGGIDEGEDTQQALWREVEEETGYKIPPLPPANSFEHYAGFHATDLAKFCNQQFYTYLFDVTPDIVPFFNGTKPTPEDGTMEWVTANDIENLPMNKIHMPSIQALLF